MNAITIEKIVDAAATRAVEPTPASLEGLPTELKLIITERVMDVKSTINLALSGPVFYAFVAGQESEIAAKCIMASIPRNFLGLAELVHLVSPPFTTQEKPSEEAAKYLISAVGKALKPKSHHWTSYRHIASLKTAKSIVDVHAALGHTSWSLAQRALKKAPKKASSTQLSVHELNRFYKALYILEIISKGFRVRPRTTSNRRRLIPEDTYAKAWLVFWAQFAPWEMQHTRIVQALISDHLQEFIEKEYLISPDEAQDDISTNMSIDDMASFILSQGPKSLRELQKRSGAVLRTSTDFMRGNLRRTTRMNAYDPRHDTLWLLKNELQQVSLDAGHIFAQFHEDDISAATNWYHSLVGPHTDDHNLADGLYQGIQCNFCVDRWAACMWDASRLNKAREAPLPTIQQLEEAVFGLAADEEFVIEITSGRGPSKVCNGDYCT
ncbi:hypothetical protein F5Y16DRAFT_403530 [Xylariaceae sp. FL0255]|nr:hypothetical protein F5Y16DRAFT_403530 [Xylariaceae sp. FL0255]